MSIPVGITVPKLLPITGTFALPISAYYGFLSSRVVYQRFNREKLTEQSSNSNVDSSFEDVLFASSRSQMNFAENVPLALLLAAVVELNGGSRKLLTAGLSVLLVSRILHAELGLMAKNSAGPGRTIGHVGTMGTIVGLAGYAAYLVKGYWGS